MLWLLDSNGQQGQSLSHCSSPALSFFFYAISASESNSASAPYSPAEVILLSCGEHSQTEDDTGRIWKGDAASRFLPSQNTTTSFADSQTSAPQVPYKTARIFVSESTYVFPLSEGWKFVRLYFDPAKCVRLIASNAIFSVSSGSFTLLRNFSPYITSKARNLDHLICEFSVYAGDGFLNLTFTPSAHVPNANGFVNGIEIVSMPNIFSEPARVVLDDRLPPQTYRVSKESALRTVVRLNVGGRDISTVEDSGLFRAWYDDSPYIHGAASGVAFSSQLSKNIEFTAGVPPYMAPSRVYATARSMGPSPYINQYYNLTWILPIDAGFNYLVRLHFCEIKPVIYKQNQRVLKIFLHNQTAERGAVVILWGGKKNGVPVYRDYFVLMSYDASPELWVALHPSTASGSQYYDAILNGIEIFKLSDHSGNLGGTSAVLLPRNRATQPRNSKNGKAAAVLVGAVAIVCLAYIAFIAFRRWAWYVDAQRLPITELSLGNNKRKRPVVISKGWGPLSSGEAKSSWR